MGSEDGENGSLNLISLRESLQLTSQPLPSFITHPSLLPASCLQTLSDHLSQPHQQLLAQSLIQQINDHVTSELQAVRGAASPAELDILGDKLATKQGRDSLVLLTATYELVLSTNQSNYKLWKDYLAIRSSYVLGTPSRPLKLNAPKKKRGTSEEGGNERSMMDFLEVVLGRKEGEELEEGERDWSDGWEGGLEGVVGYEEWRSLAATHERALMWLPTMPRIWLSYLSIFLHPRCPSTLSQSHARKTFDRALRTLPSTLHSRLWRLYLVWATKVAGEEAGVRVWRRYLAVDPTPLPLYLNHLLSLPHPRALEAAKHLLQLSLSVSSGAVKHPEGKSGFQLLVEWLEVCEKYPQEVGVGEEEGKKLKEEREKAASGSGTNGGEEKDKDNKDGKKEKPAPPPLTLDPLSPELLDVDYLARTYGLSIFTDQSGRLWTLLATYWIKHLSFTLAIATFEEALATVVTLRDFTQVFDAYAEFSENYIASLMENLQEMQEEGEDAEDEEKELDEKMKEFEELMDRRPFLVNEVLLRRNPNDVQEWEKRVVLYGTEDDKVSNTYSQATSTIQPRKATTSLHSLWINYAKFYESGGVSGTQEKDIKSARKVFEKATRVNFRKVEELAEIWCEWSEMEVRNENYDEAIKVMQRATQVPKKWNAISFHDEQLSPQTRLFKSLKLWSFYSDLEESIGTVESTKAVYDRIFELKIANAQIVINCANFLEENQFWEESFKVYERGVDLFTYPVAFEIWNTYLTKFMKRYGGDKLERARDLFEQALEDCPPKFAKPLYLLYGKLEEEYGLAKRAMAVYERATKAVDTKDRMEMFTYYIAKATANFGLPATRPIYERAIEVLPDRQTAEMCLRFAALERKLGEIDRARAIFAHASQFCDPRSNPDFWTTWNSFEIETGSEDTFREFLRIKRAVQAAFNTEASYLAAKAAAVSAGGAAAQEAVEGGQEVDPMAALDAATGRGPKPAFVPSKERTTVKDTAEAVNEDEIEIEDEDDDE
ncbi:TPR-like protein [Meredithblackwellia eburnea MCA 4105]